MYLGLQTIRRGNTAQCVQDIFQLHFPEAKTVLDCTFGAGRFWKWDHNLKVTGVDIAPLKEGIIQADYRNLPFGAGSVDVMCFDPVFIFTKGIRRVIGTKRFFEGREDVPPEQRTHSNSQLDMPRSPSDLLAHYRRIFEQRVIAKQGLILKGQNLIVTTKRDYWLYNVMKLAEEMGMGMPDDYLIQHSPATRMIDPRWKTQRKFRTAECFYLIYRFQGCCGQVSSSTAKQAESSPPNTEHQSRNGVVPSVNAGLVNP